MKVYETSDFYLACFLICSGYELSSIRRVGARVVFVFQDKSRREDDVVAFFANRGSVKPLSFVRAVREMKALIHTTR